MHMCALHDLDDPTCPVNVDFNWKLNAYHKYRDNSSPKNLTSARKALGRAYYHLDETAEQDVVACHRIRGSL